MKPDLIVSIVLSLATLAGIIIQARRAGRTAELTSQNTREIEQAKLLEQQRAALWERLVGDNEDLRQQIDRLNDRLTAMEKRHSDDQARIGELETQHRSDVRRIDELEREVGSLRQEIADRDETIRRLRLVPPASAMGGTA